MARPPTKKQRQQAFAEAVQEGVSPEMYILDVMRGKRKVLSKQTKAQYDAAIALLPFRLPRLNNIDATQKNVDQSHEDFIKGLEDET